MTSWTRSRAPSFVSSRDTWDLAVAVEMKRSSAISVFDRPRPTRASTSRSRSVMPSTGRGGRSATGDARLLIDQRIYRAPRGHPVTAGCINQSDRHALLIVEQCLQVMGRRDPLVVLADRDRLGCLQEAARAVGKFLNIHESPLGFEAMWCVTVATQEPQGRGESGSDGGG